MRPFGPLADRVHRRLHAVRARGEAFLFGREVVTGHPGAGLQHKPGDQRAERLNGHHRTDSAVFLPQRRDFPPCDPPSKRGLPVASSRLGDNLCEKAQQLIFVLPAGDFHHLFEVIHAQTRGTWGSAALHLFHDLFHILNGHSNVDRFRWRNPVFHIREKSLHMAKTAGGICQTSRA